MANRSQFGSPPATGGSGGIGNVVGPSSAVNNNLAAFDGTTGELLEDSGIATSQVATSQTAATAVARLALTGLARGARVYQTDNGFWYELTNAAAPSDAASWAIQRPVQTAVLEADFPKTNDTFANVTDLTLTGLLAGHWYFVQFAVTPSAGAVAAAVMDLAGGTATVTGMKLDTVYIEDGAPTTASLGALADTFTAAAGFNTAFNFSGVIQINGAGTLIPRLKQSVTDASACNVLKYAAITAIDVTPE